MFLNDNRISKLGLLGAVVLGFGLNGCISDDGDEDSAAAGSGTGGAASGGNPSGGSPASAGNTSSAGKGGGTSSGPAGTACASPIKLAATSTGITNFDDYDGAAALDKWSFALGGDASTGVFSGPFGYGDGEDGKPEKFEMVAGNDSTYALSISDSMAEEYGGGLGLWMSECLDATAFSGISFWVKGNAPTGDAKFTLLMQETTPAVPETADSKKGTCDGTAEECIHPNAMVPVTDAWTEVKIPWADFMPGSANGNPVAVDGSNVWQLQVDVGLVWAEDEAGEYHPTAAPYEIEIDDIAFY